MENEYIEELKEKEEIIPDDYDGSYELVRETVKQYDYLPLEQVGYADIDLIFFMCIGTWKFGIDSRKKLIEQSCLEQVKKDYLISLLDRVMNNAKMGKYAHSEVKNSASVGMFGCGYGTFKGLVDLETIKRFILLVVNVNRLNDEEEILNYVEEQFKLRFKGIGVASFSQFLHCLKPYIFPIINGKQGEGAKLYYELGIKIDNKITLENYIKNTRIIREFREDNFKWKNYRNFDLMKVEDNYIKDEKWIKIR